MYYIYYIEGKKIGVTTNIPRRMQQQGFTEWEILEVHTDIYEVSDKEQQLQRQYGLPVDKEPYWKTMEKRMLMTAASHTPEANQKRNATLDNRGSRTGGIPYMDKETVFRVSSSGGKASRTLTMEQANEIRSKYIKKYGMIAKLAKEYNVTTKVIGCIVRNQSYINE
jgi:hypothetical protein